MLRMRPTRGRRRASPRPRGGWSRLWDGLLTAAILGLLALLAARLDRTETRVLEGPAIVNDGDTITLGSERIRLRGIDAPEFNQTCGRAGVDYSCGRRAREALVGLVAGRAVSCSGRERDKYDRLLAICTAGGIELNRGMVEAGWAVAYGDYHAEEEAAHGKGIGLWAGSFERPRDWREMHGGAIEAEHAGPGFLHWLMRLLRFS